MALPMAGSPASELQFPRAEPPPVGQPVEIATGILWLRMALPYALDHVNLYLIEDRGGWAVFDTGISDEPSQAIWEQVLAGPLGGKPITRLVVSHFHPDHVGLAGWLDKRFDMPLYMGQAEYLMSRFLQMDHSSDVEQSNIDFYLKNVSARRRSSRC